MERTGGDCGASSPRRPGTGSSERRCDLISLLPLGWGSYWQTLAHADRVRAPRCPEPGAASDSGQRPEPCNSAQDPYFLSDVFLWCWLLLFRIVFVVDLFFFRFGYFYKEETNGRRVEAVGTQ